MCVRLSDLNKIVKKDLEADQIKTPVRLIPPYVAHCIAAARERRLICSKQQTNRTNGHLHHDLDL